MTSPKLNQLPVNLMTESITFNLRERMARRSGPRRARSAGTQTENHRFRRHVAVFVILIRGTSVSYLRQSALTGPTDKPLYERAGLRLWNPSSAFCLVQLANDSNQRSRSFREVFPGENGEKCGTVWKKRNHSREERINEWKGEVGLINQIKERMTPNCLRTLAEGLL